MPPEPTKAPGQPDGKCHGRSSDESHLAGLIWRACLDAGHPIGVPASRHAAAAALAVCDPPPPMAAWPQLMVDLHEWVCPGISAELYRQRWSQPGLLAERLRTFADRLDAVAHARMLDQLQEEAA